MAVAGLKINFWKFFKGQNLGLDDGYHVSKNLSKISTLRGQNCILRGSIPPSLARCNASFPRSRASLLLPRTVCPCPAYLHREATRVAAEYARVHGAAVKTHKSMGKKHYNARDRAGYFRAKCDFDPLELELLKDFGHMRVLIKAELLPQSKFSKVNFQASHSHFF